MKQYSPDKIKNVALIGHAGSGKTSISEALLYDAKITTRIGRTDEGNTVSDFEAEETKRKISIRATVLPFEYDDHKINLIDTPGYADFIGEVISSLWAADSAVFVACGVNGLGVGASSLWQIADQYNLPRIIVVNKLDKERSD
ncbi:MAG: GTP-binding protein [Candidatus Margulisiibacteriota bacterium]